MYAEIKLSCVLLTIWLENLITHAPAFYGRVGGFTPHKAVLKIQTVANTLREKVVNETVGNGDIMFRR